ncbi:MAG: hypothetical protein WC043_02160 [Pseudobdellovibrionaceae bacterium]
MLPHCTPRIAILAEPRLAYYGMKHTLQQLFPGSPIEEVSSSVLNIQKLTNYDLLIMPGINGEDSPYPTLITPARKQSLRYALKHNGLCLLTICAATYSLFDYMFYLKSDGTHKDMPGFGFVSGTSRGPAFAHITRAALPTNSKLNDIQLAGLYNAELNIPFHYHALEFNGPALYPDDKLAHVFLRHACVPENPAAAIIKPYGKGLILGFGPHIEIPLTFFKMTSLWQMLEAQKLDFSPHEPSRIALLDTIKHMITAHVQSLKTGMNHDNLLQHPPYAKI